MTHPLFLLKHDDFTIAALRILSDLTAFDRIEITGTGCFTTPEAANFIQDAALNGTPLPLELAFETGRRERRNFKVDRIQYAGTHYGERNYQVALTSQ
jgi:hypothetical protein